MKNVLKPSAKRVLIPLGLAATASTADGGIHKNILGSRMTKLIGLISNEENGDIMKINQSLEESGFFIINVSETIENEGYEQKGRFLSMLLDKLGASLLENLLTGK